MSDEISNAGFRIERYLAPEAMPTEYACRLIRLPSDPRIFAAVSDVLVYLAMPGVWEESENVADEQMQYLMSEMFYEFSQPVECSAMFIPTGTINPYIGTTAPDGWLLCNGAQYDQADYPDLTAVLPGALKSGDVFNVPDMRGRMPVGVDPVNALFPLAETGGEIEHALTVSELPSHTHIQNSHNHTQDSHNHTQNSHNHTQNSHDHTQDSHTHTIGVRSSPTGFGNQSIAMSDATGTPINLSSGIQTANNQVTTATNIATTATNIAATATNQAATATNQNTGSNLAHNNMPPYFSVNWIIKT